MRPPCTDDLEMTFEEQQSEVKYRSTKCKTLYKPPFGYEDLIFTYIYMYVYIK